MDIFLFVIIILFASILQTSTRFCFSILATPFLLLLYSPMEAVQINLILLLIISCALIRKIRKDIDFQIIKRFVIGSIAGLPVGLLLFLFVDVPRLKLGVSVIILLLTLLLIMKLRIAQTKPRDFITDGLSRALTTSIGMPGPPLLLYFSGTDTEKEKLRGTTLAFYRSVFWTNLIPLD